MDEAELDKQGLTECAGVIKFSGPLYHGGAGSTDTPRELTETNYTELFAHGNLPPIEDATLGAGYYLCEDSDRAIQYAQHKTGQWGEHPYVRTLQLTEIPLYDFRDKQDPKSEAAVPFEMVVAWLAYYQEHRAKVLAFCNNRSGVAERLERYAKWLGEFIDCYIDHFPIERGYGLQSMLATLPGDPSRGLGTVPLWAGLFSSFMQERYHVDGFIAIQGGEDTSWDDGVTYVLTSLPKPLLSTQVTERL